MENKPRRHLAPGLTDVGSNAGLVQLLLNQRDSCAAIPVLPIDRFTAQSATKPRLNHIFASQGGRTAACGEQRT